MAIRDRRKRSDPLRWPLYMSDVKLEMLLGQIGGPASQGIAAELKLDFKLVSLTLTRPGTDRSLRQRSLLAKYDVVSEGIRRRNGVGDLTATRGFFAGDIEMDWKPLDDNETVLFCGYAGKLLVVLGGSVSNVTGLPSSEKQIGSHPHTIREAVRGTGEPGHADLGRDLVTAARSVFIIPQMVSFLARVISRGPLPEGSAQTEYLLGTPIGVVAVDMAGV